MIKSASEIHNESTPERRKPGDGDNVERRTLTHKYKYNFELSPNEAVHGDVVIQDDYVRAVEMK
jgi:hypothetical protein